MTVYYGFNDLRKGITEELQSVTHDEIANQMRLELERQIDEKFYQRSSGNFSEDSLRNSVNSKTKTTTGDLVNVSVFVDTNKMTQWYPSWVDNSTHKIDIVGWLNDGTTSRLYSHPAYMFIEYASDAIFDEVVDWYKQYLKKRGCGTI